MLSRPSLTAVPGRDHLECPDQPGLLPGFELCYVIPGVRHDVEFYANGSGALFSPLCRV